MNPFDPVDPSTWTRYSETKDDGGKVVLVRYPEGYRLRFDGVTVWREDDEPNGQGCSMAMMIERVARAICNASGIDPDGKFKSSDYSARTAPHEYAWHEFLPEARAAIEAMREPTEPVGVSGEHQVPEVALRIEAYATNPPRPAGVSVIDGNKVVGVISIESLLRCIDEINGMGE